MRFRPKMTLARFRLISKAYTEKATRTKTSALRTLQREGILDKDGNLTKKYRTTTDEGW
jgi:hypothetical protein